jgi:putative oxidoreductase
VPNNPVYSFFATPGSFAPSFLRLALAAVFFYRGVQQTFGWFGGAGWKQTIDLWTSADGYNLPYIIVAFLLIAELAVCVALFFGFLTRLAAFAVVIIMGIVLIFVHRGSTFEAIEFPLVLLATALSLVITGGGHLSIDRAISVNLLPHVG